MMIVYRVECEACGRGPYQCGHSSCPRAEDTYGIAEDLSVAHTTTTGGHAPPPVIGGAVHCAMDSEESLARWFRGFGGELDTAGFVVAQVEIDGEPVLLPEGQVTYTTGQRLDSLSSFIDWK